MSFIKKIASLDHITKGGFVILLMILFYIIFLYVLRPVFIEDTAPSHNVAMGDHMMTFTSPGDSNLNLAAIFLAFLGGFGIWLIIRSKPGRPSQSEKKTDDYDIIKRALSDDERKIMQEIRQAGEITQDSLRFRLNWSKAKVSAILLQLDRMNLIQRERQGKTYKIFISKK